MALPLTGGARPAAVICTHQRALLGMPCTCSCEGVGCHHSLTGQSVFLLILTKWAAGSPIIERTGRCQQNGLCAHLLAAEERFGSTHGESFQ
jgi:hypothetical protein